MRHNNSPSHNSSSSSSSRPSVVQGVTSGDHRQIQRRKQHGLLLLFVGKKQLWVVAVMIVLVLTVAALWMGIKATAVPKVLADGINEDNLDTNQVKQATIKTSTTTSDEKHENDCLRNCQAQSSNTNLDAADEAAHLSSLLNTQGLRQQLHHARAELKAKLVELYGEEYYQDLFLPYVDLTTQNLFPGHIHNDKNTTTNPPLRVSIGRDLLYTSPERLPLDSSPKGARSNPNHNSTGMGWNRWVRKFQIKLVQIQLGVLQKQEEQPHRKQQQPRRGRQQQPTAEDDTSSSSSYCQEQCRAENHSDTVTHNNQIFAAYHWMTAGDGSAAGVGNFLHQSYTAVLEAALQPLLRQYLGLDFVADNYAMRRMSSAPEVAWCNTAIYGKNTTTTTPGGVDSMVWDFTLADGKDHWKLALFAHRLAQLGHHRQLPALLALTPSSQPQKKQVHWKVLRGLEQAGMSVLVTDPTVQAQQTRWVPDSAKATTVQALEAIPPNLRYLKCEGELEDKGPKQYPNGKIGKLMCRESRFDRTICRKRLGMTIWEPGWKAHALRGYSLAMMVLDLISDAIEEIAKLEQSQPEGSLEVTRTELEKQLQGLRQTEALEYDKFLNSEKLLGLGKWHGDETKRTVRQHMDLMALFKAPALCHTALLPAETRYLGLLTQNSSHNPKRTINNQTYDKGFYQLTVDRKEMPKHTQGVRFNDDDQLLLVTHKEDYDNCEEQLTPYDITFQDAFLATNIGAPRFLTIPNDLEQRHFSDFNVHKSRGWIFICFYDCKSKCPGNNLSDKLLQGKVPLKDLQVEVTVNGFPVSELGSPLADSGKCRFLVHESKDDNSKRFTWTPNEDGKYTIQFDIKDKSKWLYLKMSSIILM